MKGKNILIENENKKRIPSELSRGRLVLTEEYVDQGIAEDKNLTNRMYGIKIRQASDRLFNAQLSIAVGVQYLYKRSGARWVKVTEPEDIEAYLLMDEDSKEAKYFMVTAQAPNNQAIDSMLDRGIGKVKQDAEVPENANKSYNFDRLTTEEISNMAQFIQKMRSSDNAIDVESKTK
jgi:hypothetical protein